VGVAVAVAVFGVDCFPHPFANKVRPADIISKIAENCGNFSHSRLGNAARIMVCAPEKEKQKVTLRNITIPAKYISHLGRLSEQSLFVPLASDRAITHSEGEIQK
jgi:hypothetical protein